MTTPGYGGEQGLPAPQDGTLSWADLAGGLPTHDDEVRAAHEGRPTVGQQDARNGAGMPAEDRGY